MITVRPYTSAQQTRWDEFVSAARNPHFIFQRGYLEYHADRFADASLLFEKGGRLVALLPAHRKVNEETGETTLCSHEGLSFGGLLVHPNLRQNVMEEIFAALVEALRQQKLAGLYYHAMPAIYSLVRGEEDLWCLEKLGAKVCGSKVSAALQKKESASFSPTFKREVRKARKAGIVMERTNEVARLYEMLVRWQKERYQGRPVHSLEELKMLRDRFPEQMLILAAKMEDQWLGAAMFFLTPACLRLQYAANTAKGMTLGVAHLLIDHAVESLPLGKWLDLGASMKAPGELQSSLHAFKESCGARTHLQKSYFLAL